MVVGGQVGHNICCGDVIGDIELISPYPSLSPVPEGLADLNPFTFGNMPATNITKSVGSAVAPGGLPLMCGGTLVLDDGIVEYTVDYCWTYDPFYDKWNQSTGTFIYANDHASDYTSSFGFAILDSNFPLQVTNDNGATFQQYAGYPNDEVRNGDAGCLVVVDDLDWLFAAGK